MTTIYSESLYRDVREQVQTLLAERPLPVWRVSTLLRNLTVRGLAPVFIIQKMMEDGDVLLDPIDGPPGTQEWYISLPTLRAEPAPPTTTSSRTAWVVRRADGLFYASVNKWVPFAGCKLFSREGHATTTMRGNHTMVDRHAFADAGPITKHPVRISLELPDDEG